MNTSAKKDSRVSLLTAGRDSHYALGLLAALVEENLQVDFIANEAMMSSEVTKHPNVFYFNLRGDQRGEASLPEKAARVLRYYRRLLSYARRTDVRIFHILWLNKFLFFDRTFLNVYYKLLGKKLVYTAHNVNAGERDDTDTFLNRASLRFMYRVVDHIFVHTDKMRQKLAEEYGVNSKKVSVIPFPVNNMIPRTGITGADARRRLGLGNDDKVLLFFGNIAPYKGLEYLVTAMTLLMEGIPGLRLVIAGRVKDRTCEDYWQRVLQRIHQEGLTQSVLLNIRYVPDEEVEVFLKAADIMILPYKHIFQSGVLFLSYSFGLPVIAADTGSLKDDIVEGETGFVFQHGDAQDLAEAIGRFFHSSLYARMEEHRKEIMEYVNARYSWGVVAEKTHQVYREVQGSM